MIQPQLLSTFAGLDHAERLYRDTQQHQGSQTFTASLLERLQVTYRVSQKDLQYIPQKGAVILVANHPFGLLDGAIVSTIVQSVRADAKILANEMLRIVPELQDLIIPVDAISGGAAVSGNMRGVRAAIEHLAGGGLLVVFPAGEVSHFQWQQRAIADSAWNPMVARIVPMLARRGIGLQVVPMHIAGANSFLFQAAGFVHPRLRTILLVRELLNKAHKQVDVRIGSPIDSGKLTAIASDRERIAYLRWRTYLLENRNGFRANTRLPIRAKKTAPVDIAAPVSAAAMAVEIAALPAANLLLCSGDFQVFIGGSLEIPDVLAEIGRLREVTFRAVGEGTGKGTDLDVFDKHYLHLFLWNAARQEVAGAYRLARTDVVQCFLGSAGLYTASLFQYDGNFLSRMGPALELGRSFIRAEYQRSFSSLLLLWKGIGKYVARNPQYKVLFGPVSISNEYHSVSQQLMVSFLKRNSAMTEWLKFIRPANPFRARHPEPGLPEGFDLDDLSTAIGDVEGAPIGIPVLLRQYLKLGGKLLGFNVDPDFSNVLDGLIVVDLTKTGRNLLERYLGKAEAAEFLAFQERTDWSNALIVMGEEPRSRFLAPISKAIRHCSASTR